MGKRLYAACAAAVVAVCAVASAGPRVTVIGDSYSTYSGTMPDGYVTCYDGSYNGVTSAAQTYWMRIINALGGTLEVNNSWSGSWVCNANNTLTTPSFISPERLAVLGDPDLFIICGGSNDCWWGKDYGLKGDDPLGQFVYSGWTADELMQFRPAFAYLLDYLKTNFPGAGILVVVNSTDDAQSAYALTEEYASSMETIAAHYSAMCVRCSGVEKVDYHPTSGGFLTIANQALAVLEAARPGGWEGFSDSLVESSTYLRNPAGGVYVANAAGAGTITAADDLLLTRMVLVGGGGAGGGTIGGGGGGGEVVDIAFDTPVAIEYGSEIDFTVGAGGQAGATTTDPGGNGGATTLVIGQTGYTALGGGGGGGWSSGQTDPTNQAGRDGANGGGGALKQPGGSALASSGHSGGASTGSGEIDYGGGGGGGAGAAGADGTDTKGGDGGAGTVLSVTGVALDYGSGGGAGAGNSVATPGAAGGAGAGAGGEQGMTGGAALAGRGGGGGGGGFRMDGLVFCRGGNGGSGSVILVLEAAPEGIDPRIGAPVLAASGSDGAQFSVVVRRIGLNSLSQDVYAVVSNQTTGAVSTNLAWTGSASAGESIVFDVDGLDASTGYGIFAYCENDVGGKAVSPETVFRTRAEKADDYFTSEITFPLAASTPSGDVVVPVCISQGSPEGFDYADCQSRDQIRFTSSSGEELAFDIDTWNSSGTSIVWVRVPSLSSSTSVNLEWYPNGDAFERALSAADTWAGYLSVWHLNEAGVDTVQTDSSANGYPLAGANGTFSSEGKFGLARTINDLADRTQGGNGRVIVAADYANTGVLSAPFTISFWAKHKAGVVPYYDSFVSQKKRGNGFWYSGGFHIQLWDHDTQFNTKDGPNTENARYFANSLSSGNWTHYEFVVGTDSLAVYENGLEVASISGFAYTANDVGLAFGAPPAGDAYDMSFNGAFDEIRVSSGARTAAQVAAGYAAMSSASYAAAGRAHRVVAPKYMPVLDDASVDSVTEQSVSVSVRVVSLGEGESSGELHAVLVDQFGTETDSTIARGVISGRYSHTFGQLAMGGAYSVYFYAVNSCGAFARLPADDMLKFTVKTIAHFESTITFPKAGASAVANVPVLVRLAENSPAGFSYSDCGSLVFRAADGTELAHDVDMWDVNGTSAVWVTVPELSSTTEIVMEWYSAAGVSIANPASTWAGYRSVWHLSETGTDAVHADASGNSLALAGQNGTVAAVGVVGNGRTISDISDWSSISTGAQNNGRGLVASGYAAAGSLPAPFTISFWAKHREGADVFFDYLFSRKSGGSAAFCSQLWYYGNEYGNYQHNMQIKSSVDGGTYVVNSASPFPNGEWRYLSFAVGSDSTLDVYENGELRQHIDGFVYADNQTALSFGNLSSLDDMSWNGEFDEIRVAATKRSAAQVEAEYLAMSDAAYVSFSAVREVDGTAETGLVIILR